MSEINIAPSPALAKQRRNNLKPELSEKLISTNSTFPRSLSNITQVEVDKPAGELNKTYKNLSCNQLVNVQKENQKSSLSSMSVVSSNLSESSSSQEDIDSFAEDTSEAQYLTDEFDAQKASSNRSGILDYSGEIAKCIKDEPKLKKPKRIWSYIKKPMRLFMTDSTKSLQDDKDSDLFFSFDYVEGNYSNGTKKRIKKLTGLYLMMNDPEVGIVKANTNPKNSFLGQDLYKWIFDNFDSNEDDFMSFLGKDLNDFDSTDATNICNILFFMGFIVPSEKTCTRFVADDSIYILQAPYLIPIAAGVPSDFDYARYLVRRVNSNKFKLQDYELKILEKFKKSFSRSWIEIETLAQKDTALFKKGDKDHVNVLKLQQQTFWRVYRPSPDSYDFLNQGSNLVKKRKIAIVNIKQVEMPKLTRLKMSKACKYIKDHCLAVSCVDALLTGNSASNPWISGDKPVGENDAISPEEIQCWTTGIYYLLQDPKGLTEFHKYLKNEFSQENLNFILACRNLEQKVVLKDFDKLAKQIYKDYIRDGAPSEINIISSIRNNLIELFEPLFKDHQQLEPAHYQIYSLAVSHITGLMEKDPYKRFCLLLKSSAIKSQNIETQRMVVDSNQNLKTDSNSKINLKQLTNRK